MPTPKKRTPRAPAKAKPKATTPASSMGASQKTIFNKLKRKGLSDKQAIALSHHAARRKDSAAAAKKTSASGPKKRTTPSRPVRAAHRGKKR